MVFSHLATKKMRGAIVQQKVSKVIIQEYPATMTADQRNEVDEFAYTSIIVQLLIKCLER